MDAHPDLTISVINGLGWLYLLLAVMNGYWAYRVFQSGRAIESLFGIQHIPRAAARAMYSMLLFLVAVVHLVKNSDPEAFPLRLPEVFKDFVVTIIA
ncbi:MAG: hypothetical protein AB7I48_07105, partial [Planctomycetaceae bacterium]